MEEKLYENEIFVDYFKKEKEARGLSTRKITEGLKYQEVLLWENKLRAIDFMLFERLLSRLGIGAEDFHFFLGAKEYDKWHKRIKILYAIKIKEFSEAKEMLEAYDIEYAKNKTVDKQFVLDMKGIILRAEGADSEKILKILMMAIEQTVRYSERYNLRNHVLAISELNIILDIETIKKSGSNAFYDILDYIESRIFDKKGLAKIYPKAAYLYNKAKLGENVTKNDFAFMIDTCNKAIEMLRDAESMYFLWELLKEREQLYEMASDYGYTIYEDDLDANSRWIKTVETIYEENDVDKESFEHTFLYLSKGVECINDVIRKRRKMLGISQEKLCDGICDLRTVQRIEARESTPQKYVMDKLLSRLGLSKASKNLEIILDTPEEKKDLDSFKKLMNNGNYMEAREKLDRLSRSTSKEPIQNRQFFICKDALIKFKFGEIDEEEYRDRLLKGLELTVPFSCIYGNEDKYFSMHEINYLHNITLGCKGNSKLKEDIMLFLEDYFATYINTEMEVVIAGHFEYIMEKVQSALGNKGAFEKSNEYSKYLVRESLRNRRFFPLFGSIYNLWWNQSKMNGTSDEKYYMLDICRDIAEIGKNPEQFRFVIKK
nr:helix-turn-helix transcriptional regulator [Lachnospiraceae bacterium]